MSDQVSSPSDRTFVVAEMAWSHNGSLSTALELLHGAQGAGADALGVHLTSLPDYMVPHYGCTDGVGVSGGRPAGDIYRYLERLSLDRSDWDRLFEEAKTIRMPLCVMCNDEPSLEFASARNPEMYVIAAACFDELAFIRRIGTQRKPVLLRIGGATLGEIEGAIEALRSGGTDDITLLHGIQLYPTDIACMNVSALPKLRTIFGSKVGLADHIDAEHEEARVLPVLAVAWRASVIEKHITVDRALKHEDYEAALGIDEFARFVRMIRSAECAMGDGRVGTLSEPEIRYRRVSRKRVVARRAIAAGTRVSAGDIAFKRSDTGVDVGMAPMLVGRIAPRDIQVDEGLDF